MDGLNLAAPRLLAKGQLSHLSHSSIAMYSSCPEKWRRRYLEREYEASNAAMTIGRVTGRAITAGYIGKIATGTINLEQVRDVASSEFDAAVDSEEVQWEEDLPAAKAKDMTIQAVDEYALTLMAVTDPTTVEEGFEIVLPETDFTTIGYLDVVTPERVIDVKTSKRARSQADLEVDQQATLYVAAKQIQSETQELQPFVWHAVKLPSPGGRSPASVATLETTRTQVQINAYLEKIALVAREIDWRMETGNWIGAAPGDWRCSATACGYHGSCRWGGLK